MSDNYSFVIMLIIYISFLVLEVKSMKKSKIEIFYKDNFLLLLIIPATIPVALMGLGLGFVAVKSELYANNNEAEIIYYIYYLSFSFAAISYIVKYIKKRIYTFLLPKNKLGFLEDKSMYDVKNN